jgi:hypothetical protein
MSSLYVNNDHHVELRKLREASGAFVAGATVVATMYESDGVTEVLGVTWPLALSYTGARGTYKTDLPASATFEGGKRYVLRVTATYAGRQYQEELVLRANKRRSLATIDV